MGRYGSGLQAATKKGVPGLYNSKNTALGNSTGLRQYYRYGLYSESVPIACCTSSVKDG